MISTRSRTHIHCDNLILGKKILRVIDDMVDLGFRLTINLDPSLHISMISNRLFNDLGFVICLTKDV